MINQKNKPYIIGGLAAVALYFVFFRRKKTPEEQEAGQLETETAQAGTPTYPNSQYFGLANTLEQAMFDLGTDEDSIFFVFNQLQNNADFLKLKQAFGTRQYSGGALPVWFNEDLTLEGWLTQELDSDERQQLNSILASKGITYRI
jgi:hypothetical protein